MTVSVDGGMWWYFEVGQKFNFYITLAGIGKDM